MLSKKKLDTVQFEQKKCPLLELRGIFFGTGAQAKSLGANAPQPSTEIVTRRGEIISRRGEMASRHWEIVNHPGNIFLFLHVPNTLQFVTSTVVFKLQQ